jgi:hypothetical protein
LPLSERGTSIKISFAADLRQILGNVAVRSVRTCDGLKQETLFAVGKRDFRSSVIPFVGFEVLTALVIKSSVFGD